MNRYLSKFCYLKGGWVTLNANFRGKGASPPTIFGTRKVESLSYRMVKKIAEKFNRLSRVHQRHRQTNRQTTDGRLMAYSERNVVRSLKIYVFDLWGYVYDVVVNKFTFAISSYECLVKMEITIDHVAHCDVVA